MPASLQFSTRAQGAGSSVVRGSFLPGGTFNGYYGGVFGATNNTGVTAYGENALVLKRAVNQVSDKITVPIQMKNSADAYKDYGEIEVTLTDPTAASEDSSMSFSTMVAGSPYEFLSYTPGGALSTNSLITASGKINVAAGTAALPSIYLNGDTDTGFYYAATNMIGVSIGGKTAEIFRSDNNNAACQHYDSEENAGGYQSIIRKARGTAVVQNNDLIGGIFAQGYDGAAYRNSSYIGMYVGGTPGTADMPGKIIFGVSADGSDYMSERMKIDAAGLVTVAGSTYIGSNCSALTFTDRTPAYAGDALGDIAKIKADASGHIDHSTLPAFAQKKIKKSESVYETQTVDGKEQQVYVGNIEHEEDGRDIGAMISVLTVAVQQLTEQNKTQQTQIDDLVKRIEKLEKK
jgi:hypothetical protein